MESEFKYKFNAKFVDGEHLYTLENVNDPNTWVWTSNKCPLAARANLWKAFEYLIVDQMGLAPVVAETIWDSAWQDHQKLREQRNEELLPTEPPRN